MEITIKHRWNGKVLFNAEIGSLRLCLELAIKNKIDLSYANLSRANLSGANLSRANLLCADLLHANLLCADLSYANLSYADLSGANLSRANLSRANLSGANGVNKYAITPLLMLYDQPGPICAYKLVNTESEGIYRGGIKYTIGETVEEANCDTDESTQCGSGINLATLAWCINEWREGYRILIVKFTAKDIAVIPTNNDGKFRVKKCKVIGEKNLVEIGLKKKEKEK